jgi:hypothetical protein
MWYALLILVTVSEGVSVYAVDSVHASEAQCLDALVTEHRADGVCAPVEIRFPEMGPA